MSVEAAALALALRKPARRVGSPWGRRVGPSVQEFHRRVHLRVMSWAERGERARCKMGDHLAGRPDRDDGAALQDRPEIRARLEDLPRGADERASGSGPHAPRKAW
jgi:hypothetical protein